jgi:predicted transglutaminase-like cysteine proteinase
MQSALALEAGILSVCRANPDVCPAAATRFLAVVETARGHEGRARLGEVNRAVNLAIRPASDLAQYGLPDVWATPLMTFASGAGDCEDYAIAKYVALRQAGVAEDDLRLVIVHDRQTRQDHAVIAARLDGQWLILDNRTMMLLTDAQVTNLTPLLALDSGSGKLPPAVVATPRQEPDFAVASRK